MLFCVEKVFQSYRFLILENFCTFVLLLHHRVRPLGDVLPERQLLLRERAEVDSPDVQGVTPLHVSSKKGHAQAVCALLASGASVNQTDQRGRTALHHCCATPGGKDVADALMEVKANVNLRDNEWNTPLHLACATGTHRTVASLLKYKVSDSAPKPHIQPILDPP